MTASFAMARASAGVTGRACAEAVAQISASIAKMTFFIASLLRSWVRRARCRTPASHLLRAAHHVLHKGDDRGQDPAARAAARRDQRLQQLPAADAAECAGNRVADCAEIKARQALAGGISARDA